MSNILSFKKHRAAKISRDTAARIEQVVRESIDAGLMAGESPQDTLINAAIAAGRVLVESGMIPAPATSATVDTSGEARSESVPAVTQDPTADKDTPEAAESYQWLPAYCDPANEVRGSRYEETADLNLKQVAALIRKDIARMRKNGEIPKGMKVSVRMDGWNALRVRITALPDGFQVYNPAYVKATCGFTQPAGPDWQAMHPEGIYTPQMQQIIDRLDQNTQSYNRDNSDAMSDYFDVRFYDGRAGLAWDLEQEVKARESAALDLDTEKSTC